MNHPQLEPRLTAIPEVPKQFGEDGGRFYQSYDALADELDEDMVKSLKSQLDSILIFAGLFGGVNSAFLALTLPEMWADPADDTNALLLQMVTGGNSTIRSADDLPSANFAPSPAIVPVNVLFALSLTLAIIVSFLAVLGQQWLVYYRKQSGGGIEYQRWEQLQRYLGARRWHLETVLDNTLPALLQLALVIFCVAFFLYTRTLSKTMCYVVGVPLAIALAMLLLVSVVGALDQWCPFKSTLSRFVQLISHNPTRYWPLILILAPLGYALSVAFRGAVVVIDSIVTLPLLCAEILGTACERILFPGRFSDSFYHRISQLAKNHDQSLPKLDQLSQSYALLGNPAALLQAAAVKRVLCTSSDFNTLIHTAVNIQSMNAREGAQYLLDDDTVYERLEELAKSSDVALASAFCCAFSHLLLGVQSAELFVSQWCRLDYRSIEKTPLALQYRELHPLKERVRFICGGLKTCIKPPDTGSNTFVELLLYFELLELILDEKSDDQRLSEWLDGVIRQPKPADVSISLVICLVAGATRILNEGLELADAPSGLQISRLGPGSEQEVQERQLQDRNGRLLKVQQQRVVMAKKLISSIGWEMQLLPSDSPQSGQTSALELIEDAFRAYTPQSPRHPDTTGIWLLEQALLFSTQSRHQRGWKSVAESSVGLLRAFDKPEDPTPDSVSTRDRLKDNRHRCAKILSQCIQAVRGHLVPGEFIQTGSPALDKLVDYWARFKDDYTQNPDLNDSDMLSSWFGIRGALDRPEESGWGPLHQQQFDEAYPSLKICFDTITSALSDSAPRLDNTTEHREAAFDGQAGRTEPDEAVADRNTPKPDEDSAQPREGAGEVGNRKMLGSLTQGSGTINQTSKRGMLTQHQ